jgi:hypothetical protein
VRYPAISASWQSCSRRCQARWPAPGRRPCRVARGLRGASSPATGLRCHFRCQSIRHPRRS